MNKLVRESLSDKLSGPSKGEVQNIKKELKKEFEETRKRLEEYSEEPVEKFVEYIKDDIITKFGVLGPFDDEKILQKAGKETKSDIQYVLDNFEDFTASCYPHIEWCKNNLFDAVRAYVNTGDALDYKK